MRASREGTSVIFRAAARGRTTVVPVLAALALAAPARAFFDENTSLDLDQDGTTDVRTQSDYLGGPGYYFSVDDWVWVPQGESFNMKSLAFDWQINKGHRHKGTLPLPNTGKWSSVNSWSSYRLETHADFDIDLTINTVGGATHNFVKTAAAHDPSLGIDNILSGLLAAGGTAQSGGSQSFADTVGTDRTQVLAVWSTVSDLGGGQYYYEYWAQNFTSSAITFNWDGFVRDPEGTVVGDMVIMDPNADYPIIKQFSSITAAPGSPILFSSMTGGEPYESDGNVTYYMQTDDGLAEFSFYAPMIQVPEPATVVLIGLAMPLLRRSARRSR